MIRHQVFFEVLAQILEDTPEWEPIICGYLTMGVFDTWVRVGPVGVANDQGVRKIRERIEALTAPYEGEREALLEVLRAFLEAPGTEPRYVAEAVMGYGATLIQEARWSLAVDVYKTVAEAFEIDARSIEKDFAAASYARRREGVCLRNIQDYRGAETAYMQAIELGKRAGDTNSQTYARLGLATMKQIRGNYAGLVEEFDALLHQYESVSNGFTANLYSDILHARGTVKHDLKLFDEAIIDYFAAYSALQDGSISSKDFILVDLGVCASDAGFWEAARDALNVVALTTKNRLAQQIAIVNLLNVAIELGDQSDFDRQRNAWRSEHCNPRFNAVARLYIAYGLEKFEGVESAMSAFREAAEFAAEAGIHKTQFQALSEIERLERLALEHQAEMKARVSIPSSMPESLGHIASVLSDMRSLAMTSHGV